MAYDQILIDPKTIAPELGVNSPSGKSIIMFAGFWSVIGLVSSAALAGFAPLWAASIINAIFLYFLAHLNHDAFHRNISGSNPALNWLNDAIGRVVSFSFWFSFPAFKAMHLAHHRHMNDPEKDADMWVANRGPITLLLACLTLLSKYELELWRMHRSKLIKTSVLIQFYAERIASVSLVVLAFVAGYGLEVVMLWLLPAFGVLPFIVFFFTYIVHHPHTHQDEIKGTNTILAPKWLLPFVTITFAFQNYHIIHHLYPRIPFHRLGHVFRKLRPWLEQQGAPIKTLLAK